MSRPQNYFRELAGVPVHYARPPIAPYASRGKSYRFYVLENVENELNACFEELWFKLEPGSVVHLPWGMKYRAEEADNLHIVVATSQTWTVNQHKWLPE